MLKLVALAVLMNCRCGDSTSVSTLLQLVVALLTQPAPGGVPGLPVPDGFVAA